MKPTGTGKVGADLKGLKHPRNSRSPGPGAAAARAPKFAGAAGAGARRALAVPGCSGGGGCAGAAEGGKAETWGEGFARLSAGSCCPPGEGGEAWRSRRGQGGGSAGFKMVGKDVVAGAVLSPAGQPVRGGGEAGSGPPAPGCGEGASPVRGGGRSVGSGAIARGARGRGAGKRWWVLPVAAGGERAGGLASPPGAASGDDPGVNTAGRAGRLSRRGGGVHLNLNREG